MPIPTQAFACQFKCGARLYRSKKRMEGHETRCFSNPARRACKTCKNFVGNVLVDDGDYASGKGPEWEEAHCLAGVSFIVKGATENGYPVEADGFSLKFDCEKWEAK